jgi:hypothetical protein
VGAGVVADFAAVLRRALVFFAADLRAPPFFAAAFFGAAAFLVVFAAFFAVFFLAAMQNPPFELPAPKGGGATHSHNVIECLIRMVEAKVVCVNAW